MIELSEKITKVPIEHVTKYKLLDKEDSTYDNITGELTVKIKYITGKDWRLIHDTQKVICAIEGQGITLTLDKALEFETRELMNTEILKLGLTFEENDMYVEPPEESDINVEPTEDPFI